LAWRVSQQDRLTFWLGSVCFSCFFTLPALAGWILGLAFDQVAAGRPLATFRLAVALVTVEAIRTVCLTWGIIWVLQTWEHMRGLLRGNLLAAQLASGGPHAGRPVASPGEATARFRDDTEDISWFVDAWIDVAGGLTFTVVALAVLVTVDEAATAVLLVPMLAVGIVTTVLGRRLKGYHRADRHAAADITGLLGDVLAAPVTMEVNGAAPAAVDRLRRLLDNRLSTVVKARVSQDAIRAFSQSTADIGLGLVLLVVAASVAQGTFDVGDVALFLSYGTALGFFPRMVGFLLARRHQATVAFDEMRRLVADDDPINLVTPGRFRFDRSGPGPAPSRRPRPVPAGIGPTGPGALRTLELIGLGALHPGGHGIEGVDLRVERGTLTVVTGPVGAGKTTLLRALLGLVQGAESQGEVRWNGAVIDDRAAFFVPPRSAWVPQVPQLLSDTLADNVLLGGDPARLWEVLETAELADDVAAMADGADTVVGPRGVRLSGGQKQRVAAARALASSADLLVVDDLSSALDVETERRLWDNLAVSGATVLAVSHRPAVLDRADQVLNLDRGRPADGPPPGAIGS
jgi:ATP-binding cassette subfamily B protein